MTPERNPMPMRLKLVALLALATAVGCAGTPTLPLADAPAGSSSQGPTIQGVVTAEVEAAEILPNEKQLLRVMTFAGIFIVPVDQAATIPPDAEPKGIGPIPGDPDPLHFRLVGAHETPTHLAYSAPASVDVRPLLTAKRGESKGVWRQHRDPGAWQVLFPKDATGPVNIQIDPTSSYYHMVVFSTEEDSKQGIFKFALDRAVDIPDQDLTPLSGVIKEARVTFKVVDAERRAVPGIRREFFRFYAYPKPQDDRYDYASPTDFDALTDLGAGRYRIESILLSDEEHGTMRFRVEVGNPTAVTTGNFYRR